MQAGWPDLWVFYGLYALFCSFCMLVNLWWHSFILEKLAAWAYMTYIYIQDICHWMVIVVNLFKTNLIYCMMLPVGVVLCMPGQYRVFLPLAAIIAAMRHGMLGTRHCRRSTKISAHLFGRAWGISPQFWGRLSILVIARPNSSQICSKGL